MAFVFKCLTDTIVLDDFKTALDRLSQHRLEQFDSGLTDGLNGDVSDVRQAQMKKSDTKLEKSEVNGLRSVELKKGANLEDLENLDLEAALRMDSVAPREVS